jgi:hypothetical protein
MQTIPHTGGRLQVAIGLSLEFTGIFMDEQKQRVEGSCHLRGCSFQQESIN